MSKTLLIVHHTPSPHTQEMFEAVVSGATDPEIEGVQVIRRPALMVSPVEMLVTPFVSVIDVPLNEATFTPPGMAEGVV